VSVAPQGLWELIGNLPALRWGWHERAARIRHRRCREVEIRTARPIPINTDGELTTHTPAQIVVMPRAISVFVPRAFSEEREATSGRSRSERRRDDREVNDVAG
jgi:diacylglycerol kinase family enzyme